MAIDKELRIRVKVDRNSGELSVIGQDIEKIESASKKSASSITALESSLLKMSAVVTAAFGVKELVNYADTWNLLEGRLKLVTTSTENLSLVQSELFKISNETRQSFEATSDMYTRIARATKNLGESQNDILIVTKAVNQAMIISGSSTQSAEAAIVQLGQALGSGKLQGDELRSILENAPRLAQAIADGMGVAVGELKNLGSEGKITSEIVFNALKSQKDAIAKEFAQMPQTIGQSITVLENNFIKLVGKVDDAVNGSKGVTDIINGISTSLNNNSDQLTVYASEIGDSLFQLFNDLSSSIGEVLNLAGDIVVGFANFFVEIMSNASDNAENNFGFFDYLVLGSKTALAGLGILFDGLKQLINYARMAYAYVSGDDEAVKKAQIENYKLMDSEDKRIDKLVDSYRKLKDAKLDSSKPTIDNTSLAQHGNKSITPPKIDKKAQSAYQKADTDIDNQIYTLTHNEHENNVKKIDDEVNKYRAAKVSEVKIAEYKKDALAKLASDEAVTAQKELDKQLKEEEQKTKKRLSVEEDMYMTLLDLSDNWYDKELYNIGKRTSEASEAGVEIVQIEEWTTKSIEALNEKRTKKEKDELDKQLKDQQKNMISVQNVFEDAFKTMEDSLVSMFKNGKFEADKFFDAIVEGIIRMQIRNAITVPLTNMLGGALDFGIGNLFSGGGEAAAATTTASANGNAFEGGAVIHAFANGGAFSNSVVDKPTLAPMALFGEAGAEAIMPLTRIGGVLGVKSVGGSGQQNVVVNITNNTPQPIAEDNVKTSFDANGAVINVVLDALNRNKGGLRDAVKGVR